MRTWVAFDCETTGYLPEARLIEIGAVVFQDEGRVEAEYQQLVRPPVVLPAFITELTGITQTMLRDADDAAAVLTRFLNWIPDHAILVAHNIGFDLTVLVHEKRDCFGEFDQPCVDSLAIARRMGEFPDNRLPTVAGMLCPNRRCHRALDDAHVVRILLLHAFSRDLHTQFPELFIGLPASRFLNP